MIWISRSSIGASAYKDIIIDAGHQALVAPLLQIENLDFILPEDLGSYKAIIMTSVNAVRALDDEKRAILTQLDIPVYAVGEQTAQLCRDSGFDHVIIGQGGVTELCNKIQNEMGAGRLLYLAGVDITQNIQIDGVEVSYIRVYKAHLVDELPVQAIEAILDGTISIILFFSARTAAHFKTLVKDFSYNDVRAEEITERLKHIKALCLSDKVVNSLEGMHFQCVQSASKPDRQGMVDLIHMTLGNTRV